MLTRHLDFQISAMSASFDVAQWDKTCAFGAASMGTNNILKSKRHTYLICIDSTLMYCCAGMCVCCSVLGTPFYLMEHVFVCAAVRWARRST